eukprot:EG_transcript_38168
MQTGLAEHHSIGENGDHCTHSTTPQICSLSHNMFPAIPEAGSSWELDLLFAVAHPLPFPFALSVRERAVAALVKFEALCASKRQRPGRTTSSSRCGTCC